MPVNTREEARDWFLQHSSGVVVCKAPDGAEEAVICYQDAEKFYKRKEKEEAGD